MAVSMSLWCSRHRCPTCFSMAQQVLRLVWRPTFRLTTCAKSSTRPFIFSIIQTPRLMRSAVIFRRPTSRPMLKSRRHPRRSGIYTGLGAAAFACVQLGNAKMGQLFFMRCPIKCQGPKCLSKLLLRCRLKNCRWCRICAMNQTTSIPHAW